MTIPLQLAQAALAEYGAQRTAKLFAQAQAKHVLHEVEELPENFPAFDPALDDKVTFAAYGILAAACSVVEQGDRNQGVSGLERAASLLQYVHGPHAIASRESAFHVFIAAMAFFAAGQYSRAFVAIRGVEQHTLAAQIVGAFLRKDASTLIDRLNQVLLRESAIEDEQLELNEWAITVAVARAVAIVSDFTLTGTAEAFDRADLVIFVDVRDPAWAVNRGNVRERRPAQTAMEAAFVTIGVSPLMARHNMITEAGFVNGYLEIISEPELALSALDNMFSGADRPLRPRLADLRAKQHV